MSPSLHGLGKGRGECAFASVEIDAGTRKLVGLGSTSTVGAAAAPPRISGRAAPPGMAEAGEGDCRGELRGEPKPASSSRLRDEAL